MSLVYLNALSLRSHLSHKLVKTYLAKHLSQLLLFHWFQFGSVLSKGWCNTLLKCALASESPAFFQLLLEFCYGQEKQLVFVQAFSKINKVSTDSFLCSHLRENKSILLNGILRSEKLLIIYTRYRLSFWNHLSRSSKKKIEREAKKCEMWKSSAF